MSSGSHRAYMVDDQKMVLTGLSMLVDAHPKLQVVGRGKSAEEALASLDDTVEILVTDLQMAGLDGIALCRLVKLKRPSLPVLLLSSADESLYAEQALDAGASGYLMKDHAPEALVPAMLDILDGGLYLAEGMWARLLPESAREKRALDPDQQSLFDAFRHDAAEHTLARRLGWPISRVRTVQDSLLAATGLQIPLQLRLLAHWCRTH